MMGGSLFTGSITDVLIEMFERKVHGGLTLKFVRGTFLSEWVL